MTQPLPTPLETPQAAYNRARALEQKIHQYRFETRPAVKGTKKTPGQPAFTLAICACGVEEAEVNIGTHIEHFAEAAGNAARDAAVVALAAQYSKENP